SPVLPQSPSTQPTPANAQAQQPAQTQPSQTQQLAQTQVPAQGQAPPPSVAQVAPKVAPETETKPEGEQQAGATILFNSPNVNPTPDSDVILHLQLNNAPNAGAISLFLNFDPATVQVKDVLQGAFMTPGAFSKSFDNGRGTININANRQTSESTSGIVATVVLHTLRAGNTTLNLSSAVVRDPKGVVIPVTFMPYSITVQ